MTFTCNPKWPEIILMLTEDQQPNDRSDIIVRVFYLKLQELLNDIKGGTIFGPINAILHSIEFQKSGLPHVHILVWLNKDRTKMTIEKIDTYISAEIPDPKLDPLGYVLVSEHMMHDLCGEKDPHCPCMKEGKCSKFYPKEF
uniref:Helitron helicase-like domain-containing protein n=1 Tax=Arundo donax TaxID=35708 RepID=A0A0A9E0R5_ARUDO